MTLPIWPPLSAALIISYSGRCWCSTRIGRGMPRRARCTAFLPATGPRRERCFASPANNSPHTRPSGCSGRRPPGPDVCPVGSRSRWPVGKRCAAASCCSRPASSTKCRALEGLAPLYGRSVFHCPYCDGWESRGRPVAVYSRSSNGVGLAIELLIWSRDLVLCTDGVSLPGRHLDRLKKLDIPWRRERVLRLEGANGRLRRVVFVDGQALDREVMFFSAGQRQASNLARQLGCAFTSKGAVRTGDYEASDVSGVYVAGDASRLVQLAIVAAAKARRLRLRSIQISSRNRRLLDVKEVQSDSRHPVQNPDWFSQCLAELTVLPVLNCS